MIKKPRNYRLPVNSLIPNMLTVISLCAGLTSIRFSLISDWDAAVISIVLAGIMDGLDGRLARILKGVTKFGAELDSLADFISFGVAPVILLYEWTLVELGGIGWIMVLSFSVCCALRLARFNADPHSVKDPKWMSSFFAGVPAPAAAGLALMPLLLSFQLEWEFFRWPLLVVPYILAISILMVSRIPTISFKRIHIKREHVLPFLLIVGVTMAIFTSYPWITLIIVGIVYILSIPIGGIQFRKLMRNNYKSSDKDDNQNFKINLNEENDTGNKTENLH